MKKTFETIMGYSSSHIEIRLCKYIYGKKYKYYITSNNTKIANFDDFEKAEMYFEGFCRGQEIGFSLGYRSGKKLIQNKLDDLQRELMPIIIFGEFDEITINKLFTKYKNL